MKKLLLSLGALATVVAPVAAVVACSSDDDKTSAKTTAPGTNKASKADLIVEFKKLVGYDSPDFPPESKTDFDSSVAKMTVEQLQQAIKDYKSGLDGSELLTPEKSNILKMELVSYKTAEELKTVVTTMNGKNANDLNEAFGIIKGGTSTYFYDDASHITLEPGETLKWKTDDSKKEYIVTPVTAAVKLGGTEGKGTITIDNSILPDHISIAPDKSTALKNGDVVTLTLTVDNYYKLPEVATDGLTNSKKASDDNHGTYTAEIEYTVSGLVNAATDTPTTPAAKDPVTDAPFDGTTDGAYTSTLTQDDLDTILPAAPMSDIASIESKLGITLTDAAKTALGDGVDGTTIEARYNKLSRSMMVTVQHDGKQAVRIFTIDPAPAAKVTPTIDSSLPEDDVKALGTFTGKTVEELQNFFGIVIPADEKTSLTDSVANVNFDVATLTLTFEDTTVSQTTGFMKDILTYVITPKVA